ncbi:PREDICTED: interferon-induced, double-stranded RNA-activated protein kinase-like [Vollenhovia emeryi]|uniref:interferon-induced, double-stranded RNA-activated protein kinase-like n=1 Tax=Vollenhovia emeryi TaxID=411798 RepID=UPI0005F4C32B|nr:PREDICTED: interferon-induced, double-stranded RNA-activated protein kinase-like [Vollenhovia emeryi]
MRLIDDTYDAVEFEELKKKYQQTLKQMFSIAYSECKSDNVPFVSKPLTPKLRYEEEFCEISFIAKGGFGKVYKAQHRLDGIEYAIKKINVPTDQVNVIHEQLNEVRTMAKLDHINIVSYKAAWIEPPSYNSSVPSTYRESRRLQTSKDQEKPCNMLFDELFDHKNGIKTKKQCKVYRNTDAIRDAISERFEELHSLDDIAEERITEESNNGKSTDFSSDIVFSRVSKSNENLDQTNINEYTKTSSSNTVTFSSKSKENFDQTNTDTDTSNSSHKKSNLTVSIIYTPKENQPSMTLYIQMALCEETLQQWLLSKTSATPGPLAKEIFRQILSGVDYMHSQQIVHHDIKPSNIFISNSGRLQIQLSDFGLACRLQIGNKHAGVGTRMYAAPEQLMGKCDIKSDIYSIGVVLTELLMSAKTRMELSNAFRDIKNGIIPDDLKHYKWVHVVTQLVQEDPTKRPMAQKVLQDLKKEDLLN